MQYDVMFTGHRPPRLGGWDEDNPTAAKVKDWLRKQVAKKAGEGAVTFVSGGALGTDQWGAEAVLDRPDLELILAIPCDQYYARWPEASRKRFEQMVVKAKEVLAVWSGVQQGGT